MIGMFGWDTTAALHRGAMRCTPHLKRDESRWRNGGLPSNELSDDLSHRSIWFLGSALVI
jgi:hypothetical protein